MSTSRRSAPRGVGVRQRSAPEGRRAVREVRALLRALRAADGALSWPEIQQLVATSVSLYARQVRRCLEAGQRRVPSPFPRNGAVTGTDVIITTAAMLKAMRLAAFEIAWFSDSSDWEVEHR